MGQLKDEVDRMAQTTQFNGQNGEKSIESKLQNKYRVVVQIKSIVINSVN